jgi:hypothetical protein
LDLNIAQAGSSGAHVQVLEASSRANDDHMEDPAVREGPRWQRGVVVGALMNETVKL